MREGTHCPTKGARALATLARDLSAALDAALDAPPPTASNVTALASTAIALAAAAALRRRERGVLTVPPHEVT